MKKIKKKSKKPYSFLDFLLDIIDTMSSIIYNQFDRIKKENYRGLIWRKIGEKSYEWNRKCVIRISK